MLKKDSILYLIVTGDKLELPLFVSDNLNDISSYAGLKKRTISMYISQNRILKKQNIKFVRVKIEEM